MEFFIKDEIFQKTIMKFVKKLTILSKNKKKKKKKINREPVINKKV